jgi:hypothetical protein
MIFKEVKTRRIIVRALSVLFLFLIAVMLFLGGKGHSLLIDNKTVEIGGKTYRELNVVEVKIGRGKEEEMLKKDRIKIETAGQRQVITVTFPGDDGNEKIIKKTFRIKLNEPMYLISLPALIGDADGWLVPFR